MTLLKNPKNMLILLFIALMLSFIFLITKHYRQDAFDHQKIDDNSEITGIILNASGL